MLGFSPIGLESVGGDGPTSPPTGGGEGPTSTTGAPTISVGPVSAVVEEGASASFSVTAAGTAPLTYDWLVNGNAYPGAAGSTLAFNAALMFDGDLIAVRVSNDYGSVLSEPAELSVTPVGTAPTAAESRQMVRWITELAGLHGLLPGHPLRVSQSGRTAGSIAQSIVDGSTTTVSRK